jgi:transposase
MNDGTGDMLTVTELARELGIGAGLLGRWARELRERGAVAFPGKGSPRDAEMADLKRELTRVRKERDFLRVHFISKYR